MEHIFCHVAQRLKPVSIKKTAAAAAAAAALASLLQHETYTALSVIHLVKLECMHHGFEVRGISGHRLRSVWAYAPPVPDKCALLIRAFL
jgi:hypothetical protein